MKEPGAGAVSCLHLMLAPLEQEIPGYQSGRYYGSDAVRSPLHRCSITALTCFRVGRQCYSVCFATGTEVLENPHTQESFHEKVGSMTITPTKLLSFEQWQWAVLSINK